MRNDWQPEDYHKDPMVNAVLNVAHQLASVSESINGLLYGLKYSKAEGMSIAEAVEKGCESAGAQIGSAIEHAVDILGSRSR